MYMILRYILMFTQEPLISPNYYKSSFSIPLVKRERERERERKREREAVEEKYDATGCFSSVT